MMTSKLLAACVSYAFEKHHGQKDKVGKPYIYHPLRVMMDPELDTEEKKCLAVVHDVFEDTDATEEELIAIGMPSYLISSLYCISHAPNEPNVEYWARILTDPTSIALAVKLADIRDNTSDARMSCLPEKDKVRLKAKYKKALEFLTKSY